MNSKLTLTLAIIALILVSVYMLGEIKKTKEKINETQSKSVFSIDSEKLNRVSIARRKTVVQFEKQKGRWVMTSPSKHLIKEWDFENNIYLLAGLSKESEIKEDVNLKDFGLQPPNMLITLFSDDSKEETLELGNRTYTGSSLYAKKGDSVNVFTVSGIGITDLEKPSSGFVDLGALPVKMDQVKSIEIKNLQKSFKITCKNDETWFVGDKKADPEKISTFLQSLSSLETEKMKYSNENSDILKKATQFIKIQYVDFDDSGLYVIGSEDKFYDCVRTPTFEMMKIKKENADLFFGINAEKFEERHLFHIHSHDVEKVEIKTKDKNIICSRKDDKWVVGNIEIQSLNSLFWELEKIAWTEKVKDFPNAENIALTFFGKNDKKVKEFSILRKMGKDKEPEYVLKIDSSIYKIEESKLLKIVDIILKDSERK